MDGINIYTKANVTNASEQVGRIYIGQEELKVRQIGHNAMLEQYAVQIGCEADLAAHILEVQGRQFSVKGLLDTSELIPTNRAQSLWLEGFHHLAASGRKVYLDELSGCRKLG